MTSPDWPSFIFDASVPFETRLEAVLQYQLAHHATYATFFRQLKGRTAWPPLLPIHAFKLKRLLSDEFTQETLFFQSSGTTQMSRSRHYVASTPLYEHAILHGLRPHVNLDEVVVLAYTPGYSENPHSSLIWMLNYLIQRDPSGMSRFLPLTKQIDASILEDIQRAGKRILLFGAAFGLMDIVEQSPITLPEGTIVMETGGMKTHRKSITREALHQALSEGFGVQPNQIRSEYGMCELLSQAYTKGAFRFYPPHWMQVVVVHPERPFEACPTGVAGQLGILDLANVYSCPFIFTEDVGVKYEDGSFEVHGRLPQAELRGCNFLLERD